MGGKRSRDKGARFERFLENALKVCFPDARRMGPSQARDPKYCDVEGTPFRIEAKHWALFTYKHIHEALEQAESNGRDVGDTRVPLAITKRDREEPLVHLTLRRFLQLVEKHFWRPMDPEDVVLIDYNLVDETGEDE
jgi:hypothetical protein